VNGLQEIAAVRGAHGRLYRHEGSDPEGVGRLSQSACVRFHRMSRRISAVTIFGLLLPGNVSHVAAASLTFQTKQQRITSNPAGPCHVLDGDLVYAVRL
jgi:hypothetical protein